MNERVFCADSSKCIHFWTGACWYEIDGNTIGAECVKTRNLPCVKEGVAKDMQYSLGDFVTIRKTPLWVFRIDKIYYKGEDEFGVPRKETLYKVTNTSNHFIEGVYVGSSLCSADELSEPINISVWNRTAYKPAG